MQYLKESDKERLRQELKLSDRTFQIMVCANYNFHEVEDFKVQYWKTACEKIAVTNGDFLISPDTVQNGFSQLQGTGMILPGLPNIFAKLKQDGVLVDSGTFTNSASSSSQDSWFSTLGTWLMPGSRKRKLTTHVGNFVVVSLIEKIGVEVMKRLVEFEDEKDNVLITVEKLGKKLHEIMPSAKAGHSEALIWWLCEKRGAARFTVDLGGGEEDIPGGGGTVRAVKIPPLSKGKATVDSNDKARLAEMIVETKLNRREKELTSQHEETDAQCKAHLRAGRKSTALMYLKKRKMLEKEINNVQDMQLKVTQMASSRAAGEVTADVLKALQQSSAAHAEGMVSIEEAEDIVDQAQQCFEDVQGVNQVLAEPSEALSSGLENEYDELLGEIGLEEKKATEARELDLKEAMLGAGVPTHKIASANGHAHKQAVPVHHSHHSHKKQPVHANGRPSHAPAQPQSHY